MHGSAAQTRERGRACFAALPGEERFAYVFGSLIFLNKQFLCTEKAKKKKINFFAAVAVQQSFFGGSRGTVGTSTCWQPLGGSARAVGAFLC